MAKPTGLLGWILAIIVFFVVVKAVGSLNGSSTTSDPPAPSPHEVALAATKLANYQWRKGGFDNILMVDMTIRNAGSHTVKDVEVTCESFGPSGTKIDRNVRVIYETVPPGKSKHMDKFNMGFQHSQAASVSCLITNLVDL